MKGRKDRSAEGAKQIERKLMLLRPCGNLETPLKTQGVILT